MPARTESTILYDLASVDAGPYCHRRIEFGTFSSTVRASETGPEQGGSGPVPFSERKVDGAAQAAPTRGPTAERQRGVGGAAFSGAPRHSRPQPTRRARGVQPRRRVRPKSDRRNGRAGRRSVQRSKKETEGRRAHRTGAGAGCSCGARRGKSRRRHLPRSGNAAGRCEPESSDRARGRKFRRAAKKTDALHQESISRPVVALAREQPPSRTTSAGSDSLRNRHAYEN